MLKNFINFINNNFLLLSYIIVIICFIPLFYFSTKFIINVWAYSDALINYSQGFIRRGFLGEIILYIHKLTDIKLSIIHAYIFIIFSSINITLYFLILKKITNSRFIFFFLLFNPLLLFFPLNDTGGYLRKEIILLTLMLFHCYLCSSFHNSKTNLRTYLILLNIVVIPGIIINTLMHDIQLFLIPFHLFLSLNVINSNFNFFDVKDYFNKRYLSLSLYIFTILPLIFFIYYPTEIKKIELIAKDIWLIDPDVSWWPMYHTTNSFIDAAINNSQFMFSADDFGTYNHLINYLLLLIISLGSIYLIFNKILKNNIKIYNHYFIFLSVFPIFFLFFIGKDWGRWLSLITWTCLLFYLQFNIRITKSYYSLFKNKIANIFSIIACCYFLFFITVPHCCKGQTIFGGFSENINLVYNIIFNNSKHINNTFKGI